MERRNMTDTYLQASSLLDVSEGLLENSMAFVEPFIN